MLIGELCYCEVPLFVKWKLLLFEDSYHLSDMLDLLKVIDAFITDINIHNSHSQSSSHMLLRQKNWYELNLSTELKTKSTN